jgi:hypothetical protein
LAHLGTVEEQLFGQIDQLAGDLGVAGLDGGSGGEHGVVRLALAPIGRRQHQALKRDSRMRFWRPSCSFIV